MAILNNELKIFKNTVGGQTGRYLWLINYESLKKMKKSLEGKWLEKMKKKDKHWQCKFKTLRNICDNYVTKHYVYVKDLHIHSIDQIIRILFWQLFVLWLTFERFEFLYSTSGLTSGKKLNQTKFLNQPNVGLVDISSKP